MQVLLGGVYISDCKGLLLFFALVFISSFVHLFRPFDVVDSGLL